MPAAPNMTLPRHLGLLIESDGPGGAEQVVAHLAEHCCVDRGMRVTVFVPTDGEGWLAERLRATPVQVEALPMGGPLAPHAIVALVNALRRNAIDLLHTHEFGQALGGASAANLRHIPHLITMHGGRYFAERKRRRAALRLAISLSGAITAVSAESASHLEENLGLRPGSVQVLPNGAKLPRARRTGRGTRSGSRPMRLSHSRSGTSIRSRATDIWSRRSRCSPAGIRICTSRSPAAATKSVPFAPRPARPGWPIGCICSASAPTWAPCSAPRTSSSTPRWPKGSLWR